MMSTKEFQERLSVNLYPRKKENWPDPEHINLIDYGYNKMYLEPPQAICRLETHNTGDTTARIRNKIKTCYSKMYEAYTKYNR